MARARVEEPAPTEETAKVHGHVLDRRLEPVPGASVHVLDRSGRRIRGATASTDQDGYFVLEWAPPVARTGDPDPDVCLRVTAGASRVIYQERHAIARPAGTVAYDEIVTKEKK